MWAMLPALLLSARAQMTRRAAAGVLAAAGAFPLIAILLRRSSPTSFIARAFPTTPRITG